MQNLETLISSLTKTRTRILQIDTNEFETILVKAALPIAPLGMIPNGDRLRVFAESYKN